MKNDEQYFEIILISLICLMVGIVAGMVLGEIMTQRGAIEAGVAEYVVNPKTGKTKFVYKTLK